MNIQQKKWLLMGSGLLVLAMLKVVMLLWWQARQSPVQTIASCQLTEQACSFSASGDIQLLGVGDGKLPFTIRMTGVPVQTQQISASFRMRDMDMGFNRFVLSKQSDGIWVAEKVRLPVCTQNRHDWLIEWWVDGQGFQAAFQTK